MSPDEIRKLLHSAAKVMVPTFRREEGAPIPNARQKIDVLEDHIFVVARWRCLLEEARLYMHEGRRILEDEWDEIEGWETVATGKTKEAQVQAKRTIKPELYDGIRTAKFLIERLGEQIKRLERDEEYAVSRAYTMITGG